MLPFACCRQRGDLRLLDPGPESYGRPDFGPPGSPPSEDHQAELLGGYHDRDMRVTPLSTAHSLPGGW